VQLRFSRPSGAHIGPRRDPPGHTYFGTVRDQDAGVSGDGQLEGAGASRPGEATDPVAMRDTMVVEQRHLLQLVQVGARHGQQVLRRQLGRPGQCIDVNTTPPVNRHNDVADSHHQDKHPQEESGPGQGPVAKWLVLA
jgi:hypothetical protein